MLTGIASRISLDNENSSLLLDEEDEKSSLLEDDDSLDRLDQELPEDGDDKLLHDDSVLSEDDSEDAEEAVDAEDGLLFDEDESVDADDQLDGDDTLLLLLSSNASGANSNGGIRIADRLPSRLESLTRLLLVAASCHCRKPTE